MVSKPGLILQHGDDGPPARFGEWLRERDLPFVVHHLGEELPADPGSHAFIASLGSESSAAQDTGWVPGEIDFLRSSVAGDVPILGLCFGGQALSLALGGGIEILTTPEIGWISVASDDAGIPPGPWMQYHFDLMHVPPGARELARSPAGPAAFRHGRHLGVQFHPEVDATLVDRWARSDPKLPATGITAEQLAEQSAVHAPAAREQAFRLFDAWWASAGAG